RKPSLPLFSTVTARECGEGNWDAGYWWRNIRQPVLFSDTIARMLELGYKTFLEVGPHPVLGGSLLECLNSTGADARVFSSMRRQQPERETMLFSLGALCVAGYRAEWRNLYPSARRTRPPFYPWKLESSWTELPTARAGRFGDRAHPLLGHASIDARGTWRGSVSIDQVGWLSDHCVNGQPIYPGAAYVETAFAAARARGMEYPFCVEHLDFVKALSLDRSGRPTEVKFSLGLDGSSFEIAASEAGSAENFVLQARGRIAPSAVATQPTSPAADREKFDSSCSGEELRANLRARGLELGPSFAGLKEVFWREGEALARVEMTEQVKEEEGHYVFHPAFLDACFGTLACTVPGWRNTVARKLFLPVTFDRVRLHRRPSGKLWAHARLTSAESHLVSGNLHVTDDEGNPVVEFEGFRARAIATTESADLLATALYDEQWQKCEAPALPEAALQGKRVRLLPADSGPARNIATTLEAAGAQITAEQACDILVDLRTLSPSDNDAGDPLPRGAAGVLALLRDFAGRAAAKEKLPKWVVKTSRARP
ncbi:MAG: polyketide synthase dehydratase domain-containing protein, partial [Chthoniobacterales bacterium]